MTAAPTIDRRTIKAQSIVQSGDIHESKPGVWRVRDVNGSKTWHYVTKTSCDCIDFARNGLPCKHVRSVQIYQAQQQPHCPECGSAVQSEVFWIGGRGYCTFRVCQGNREHRAVRA